MAFGRHAHEHNRTLRLREISGGVILQCHEQGIPLQGFQRPRGTLEPRATGRIWTRGVRPN